MTCKHIDWVKGKKCRLKNDYIKSCNLAFRNIGREPSSFSRKMEGKRYSYFIWNKFPFGIIEDIRG